MPEDPNELGVLLPRSAQERVRVADQPGRPASHSSAVVRIALQVPHQAVPSSGSHAPVTKATSYSPGLPETPTLNVGGIQLYLVNTYERGWSRTQVSFDHSVSYPRYLSLTQFSSYQLTLGIQCIGKCLTQSDGS